MTTPTPNPTSTTTAYDREVGLTRDARREAFALRIAEARAKEAQSPDPVR